MSHLDMHEIELLFRAHTQGASHFTRRMAIAMAAMDGTTPKELVVRLERLKLLEPGSWDWFRRNGGITQDQIEQVAAEASALRAEPAP